MTLQFKVFEHKKCTENDNIRLVDPLCYTPFHLLQHSFYPKETSSIFRWGIPLTFLKNSIEIGQTVKATNMGNLRNTLFFFYKKPQGIGDSYVIQIFNERLSGALFYKSVKGNRTHIQ